MAKLFNTETGAIETVPDGKVADYLAKPNYRQVINTQHEEAPAPADEDITPEVNVIDPHGNGGTIPRAQLKDALREGYQVETPEQTQERKLQQEYGDQYLKTGVEAGLNTVTLGGYAAAAPALGITSEEAMRERAERNPIAHGIGTVAGFLVPNPIGWAGDAGKLAAEAAGLGRVGTGALRGAAEMGAYSFGRTNTETALSRDPFNAEAYASRLWHNLAEDVPSGVLLGGGAELLTAGASKALAEVKGATKAARNTAEELRAASSAVEELKSAKSAYEEIAGRVAAKPKPKTIFERIKGGAVEEAAPARIAVTAEEAPKIIQQAEAIGLKASKTDILTQAGVSKISDLSPKQLQLSKAEVYRSVASEKLAKLEAAEAKKAQMISTVSEAGSRLVVGSAVHSVLGVPGLAANWMLGTGTVLQPAIERLITKLVNRSAEQAGVISSGVRTAIGLPGKAAKAVKAVETVKEAASGATQVLSKSILQVPWGHVMRDAGESGGRANTPTAGAKMTALGLLFSKRSKELSLAVADPSQARRMIHESLAPLWQADPRFADQVEQHEFTKMMYVADKMPKNPGLGTAISGFSKLSMPSDAEISKWSRVVEIANDPNVILRDLKNDALTSEQVEAFRTLYPEMYQRMRMEVITHAAELQEELPWSKKLTLTTLLDAPVDTLLKPSTIAAMQADYQMQAQAPQVPPMGGDIQEPQPTRAQQLASK